MLRTSKRFLISLVVAVLVACGSEPIIPTNNTPAALPTATAGNIPTETVSPGDVIFYNGTVLILDEAMHAASAIAIRGDKILATGSDDDMFAFAGLDTQMIDLEERTVMPAFVDAHNHLYGRALDFGMSLQDVQDFAFENGITTTAEMGADRELLEALLFMASSGELRLRTSAYLLFNTACGDELGKWFLDYIPLRPPDQRLRIGGVKAFADGGSCNVPAVSFEFPVGGNGDLYFNQENLNNLFADLQRSGYQIAIHSLGDRSLDAILEAYEFALQGTPNTQRHRIEHNAVVREDQLARYSNHQLVPLIFAPFATCSHLGDTTQFKYIIPEAYRDWEWRWRDLIEANPDLNFDWHSDWPVFGLLNGFEHLWGL